VAGIPVTLRGLASSLAVVTGSERDGSIPERLEAIARAVDTLVVLMPLGNLESICARLASAVGPDRPAALVASATLRDQQVVRAPIARIARAASEAGIASPATLLVGEVVDAIPVQQVGALVANAGLGPGVSESMATAGRSTGSEEVGR
jgi:siroheme synthase